LPSKQETIGTDVAFESILTSTLTLTGVSSTTTWNLLEARSTLPLTDFFVSYLNFLVASNQGDPFHLLVPRLLCFHWQGRRFQQDMTQLVSGNLLLFTCVCVSQRITKSCQW
jgi:hypothetical protein